MAVLVDETERRIIPAWKAFGDSTPELQPIKQVERQKSDISSFVNDWISCPNMANAGDLISSAIVNGRIDIPEVKEAAEFVVLHESDAPVPLLNRSKDFFSHNEDLEVPTDNTFLGLCGKISKLKHLLQKYPKDAILHIEIARCYLALGVDEKAELHVRFALAIDCNNRYVVRCASRFFIHVHKKEDALRVIRKSRLTTVDPWLLASEISISQINDKISRNVKRGVQLINSGNFSAFDLTELRSAIGTLELSTGAYSKSRKLFNDSLLQPNSNSLAQARWVKSSKGLELNFDMFDQNTGQFVEAKSYKAFAEGDYAKSVELAKSWIRIEPYSTRTILYAYNVASNYLLNEKQGKEILADAIKTHRNDPVILNDYAYSLALNGEAEEALKIINKAKTSGQELSEIIDICITATKGLIAFRQHNYDLGNYYYKEAIQRTLEHKDRSSLNHSALLNYCREVLTADNSEESKNIVNGIIDKIPVAPNNAELTKLRKQVIDLLAQQN